MPFTGRGAFLRAAATLAGLASVTRRQPKPLSRRASAYSQYCLPLNVKHFAEKSATGRSL
jgi:hypothetical protein